MDCVRSKPRMNVEDDDDRLSILPDDIIHKILSFMSIKDAIGTSSLSSRWRFLWTSMQYLNISIDNPRFVNRLLSRRNDEIEVYSVKLTVDYGFNEPLLKLILDYTFSHNVKELTVSCLVREKIDFPLYLFRSRSLQYLRLSGHKLDLFDAYSIILADHASSWELPSLTTLHIDNAAFYDAGLFSKCANLKIFILNNFTILKGNSFTLCHHGLSDLTLKDSHNTTRPANVVAPQLKNLTIINSFAWRLVTVTAPNLASLLFHGSCLLQFSTDLPSLEKVDLCIFLNDAWTCCRIVALLQGIRNVKFLMLNLEFIEPLNSYMERSSLKPSPFSSLKSLKIYPVYLLSDDKKIIMTSEVINYFLHGSPSANFTLISYEKLMEKRRKAHAIAYAIAAQNLMASLKEMLKNEKANIEKEITCMSPPVESHVENSTDEEEKDTTNDQDKAPLEKMQLHYQRKLALMKRCSDDVSVRIDRGKQKTCLIISKLREIEVLLLKDLPTSKKEELQACFPSLRSEVDTVVEKILHHMMVPHILLNDRFNELATASPWSS